MRLTPDKARRLGKIALEYGLNLSKVLSLLVEHLIKNPDLLSSNRFKRVDPKVREARRIENQLAELQRQLAALESDAEEDDDDL